MINKYSPEQLSQIKRVKELCQNDLIKFGKFFLPGDFVKKSTTPQFHYEIAEVLMNKDGHKQVALILPRGHAKTTYVKTYILHELCYNELDDPPLFFGWVADNLIKSQLNLKQISDHLRFNQRIRTYFPSAAYDKNRCRVWNSQEIELPNGCVLISRSNARSLRGETIGSIIGGAQRYHGVFLDDIENEDTVLTLESRQKLKDVVLNAIYNALDVNVGRLIFTGTPIHYDSFCQNILDGWHKARRDGVEEEYSWKVISYKATQPNMEGGVLWHSYFPREKLDEKRKFFDDNQRLQGYYQEYELQPQGNEQRIWTRDHYIIHNASYTWNDLEKQSYLIWNNETFPVNCFWGCDPATDIETRTSDNSVIMVIAEDNLKRVFVLEYISELAIPQLGLRDKTGKLVGKKGVVDHIFEMNDKYHCLNGTVEDVGMTRGVMQDIDAEKYRRHRWDLIANPTEPEGRQKQNKIKTGLSTLFSYRLIHLRDEHYSLREEIENFGPKMKHDDEIETLFFCTLNMYPPEFKKEKMKWHRVMPKQPKSWVTA